MIDTIKIVVPFSQRPHWYNKARLQFQFDADSGLVKAVANPSSAYKKMGIYQPRLTYTERPRGLHIKAVCVYVIYITAILEVCILNIVYL